MGFKTPLLIVSFRALVLSGEKILPSFRYKFKPIAYCL